VSRLARCAHARQSDRKSARRLVLLPAICGLLFGLGWPTAAHATVTTLHDFRGDSAQSVAMKVGHALLVDPDRPSDLSMEPIGHDGICRIVDVATEPIACSTRLDLALVGPRGRLRADGRGVRRAGEFPLGRNIFSLTSARGSMPAHLGR
jgi:hypothetical protein